MTGCREQPSGLTADAQANQDLLVLYSNSKQPDWHKHAKGFRNPVSSQNLRCGAELNRWIQPEFNWRFGGGAPDRRALLCAEADAEADGTSDDCAPAGVRRSLGLLKHSVVTECGLGVAVGS
eukprot:1177371-Prorocentrum_minimum.AAC.2